MTDRQLQEHVLSALEWEPSVDAAEVGVTVENGVVTLRGDVKSYAEKEGAERVTLRVCGVKAVANDLRVRLLSAYGRTDGDIAQAAVYAIKRASIVPDNRVTISVRDAEVILRGTLDWHYQKDAAARAVRELPGVRDVTNQIVVKPRVKVGDVETEIDAAITRSAEVARSR